MAYIVNNTRGQVVAVVDDGTINTTATSLTLLGKNYSPYGQINLENLVKQLENFANSTPPSHPQEGQIWYDIDDYTVKTWTGTIWKPVSGLRVSTVLPTQSIATGDLWWNPNTSVLKIYSDGTWQNPFQVPISATAPVVGEDGEFYYNTANKSLYISDGSQWLPIQAAQPPGFGVTTWENTTLTANNSTVYPVIIGRVNNEPIVVVSSNTFNLPTPTTLSGFGLITKGITVSNDSQFDGDLFGTALQATKLETARTINGVAFDGTANITVPLSGIVNVAQGGTNITSYQPGEVLIGTNSGLLSNSFITGVAPIIVTNGDGTISIGFNGTIAVSGGPGISTSIVGDVNQITNTGVISLTAGANIGLSGSNGNVTITNTGVKSIIAGTGMAVANDNGNVTITNLGGNVADIVTGNPATLLVTKDPANVYTLTALASGGGDVTQYLSGDVAGTIKLWAGATPPAGWFICDGSPVGRTRYAKLFERIGTTYGSGDGSTTFNLPDMRGRMAIGVQTTSPVFLRGQTGGNLVAQLPAHSHPAVSTFTGDALSPHTHTINDPGHGHILATITRSAFDSTGGPFGYGQDTSTGVGQNVAINSNTTGITISAATAGTPTGNVTTTVTGVGNDPTLGNLPPYLSLIWIVKMEDEGVLSNFLFGSEKAGAIKFWSAPTAPEGWVFCRGQTLSKTTYPTLFSRIGYVYGGSGDDFKVPDYSGRFPLSESGTKFPLGGTGGYADSTLPSHTHTLSGGKTGTAGTHTHSLSNFETTSAGSHTHQISDPGHKHSLDSRILTEAVPGVSFGGTTPQDASGPPPDTGTSKTGISIVAGGSHTHGATGTIDSAGGHTHDLTGSLSTEGVSATDKNYPPYLVTNAIIKLEDDLVSALTPGPGIGITGVGNVTITNTGVRSITAGAGVTISNTTGDITISARGGGGDSGDLAGSMKMWAGETAPTGWQFCNGDAVSRTTYAKLFERIGTTYGPGDGTTTFNLPNLVGRAGIGSGTALTFPRGSTGVFGGGPDSAAGTISILSSTRMAVPDGYLVCNGAEYPTSQYPDLFAAIQYDYGGSGANFRVPDYRAMFLRGLDEGRGIDPQRTISATFQKGSLHWSDSLSSPGSAPGDVGIYALTSGSSDTTASTNKNIGFDSYGAVRNFYQPSYVRTEFPAYTSKNTPVLASTIIGGTANYTEWLTLTGIGNLQWPDGYWKHDGLYGISRPHNMAVRYVIKAKATAGGGGYLAAPWIIKMNDSGLANGQLEAGTGIDLVLLPTGATQINAIGQGGGGAIAVQQNSVAKGAATTLNFVNSSISVAGSVATITGQAGGGDYAGTIKLWTGSTPPDPTYAFCDGSLVDRVQFATLFSRIGNTYGAGTATQFRLPDFRNRFAVGSGSTYSRGATGGSADAVVVSHRHQLRDPVSGAQFFGINDFLNSGVAPAGWQRNPPFASPTINSPLLSDPNSPWVGDGPSGTNDASLYGWTDTVGESGTNKNLPPYLSCFYVIKLTDDGFSTGSLAQGTGIVLTQLPNGQTQISATPVPSSGALSAWGTGTRAVIPSDNTAINFVGAYNISSGTFTKTVVTVGLQTSAYFTWRINFTTPMANTNYAVMTNFEGPVPDAYTGLTPVTVIEKTTTYFVARTPLASNAATPAPTIMVMVAGGV